MATRFGTGNGGTHTFSQLLNAAPLYDAVTDFAPISMITEGGYVLIARNDLPASSLPQFIAYVKDNQAKMQYGSAGTGSGTHVVCALLNMTIGVNVTHVPYRATNLATSGHIGRPHRLSLRCHCNGSAANRGQNCQRL